MLAQYGRMHAEVLGVSDSKDRPLYNSFYPIAISFYVMVVCVEVRGAYCTFVEDTSDSGLWTARNAFKGGIFCVHG